MKALAFLLAHQGEIAAVCAALVALLRAVPADFWARNPRLGALARFCRAAFPDVVKAARALAAVARPASPADPPPPARLVVLPPPPAPKEPQ